MAKEAADQRQEAKLYWVSLILKNNHSDLPYNMEHYSEQIEQTERRTFLSQFNKDSSELTAKNNLPNGRREFSPNCLKSGGNQLGVTASVTGVRRGSAGTTAASLDEELSLCLREYALPLTQGRNLNCAFELEPSITKRPRFGQSNTMAFVEKDLVADEHGSVKTVQMLA